jgi:ketosteroid isomerase-like protein
MAIDNAERVRVVYEAMARGDIAAVTELLSPDVEFRNPDYAMEPGTRHGHEGFRAAMESGMEVFDEVQWHIERIVEQGDVVVVTGRTTGRGRGGGVPFEAPFAHVVEIDGDKAVSIAWFRDADEAFAAAGISPD